MGAAQPAGSIEVKHMTSSSTGEPAHPREPTASRLWLGRMPRVIVLLAVGLLAVGTFLFWGPIGLGNGPLNAALGAEEGSGYSGHGPIAFVIPIYNSKDTPVVIDGLDLIGGTSYPRPHLLGLEVLASAACAGAWPAHPAGRGFSLAGCGGADAGPLIGHAFGGPSHRLPLGLPAAAEVTGPAPRTCWVMTKVVVHYHVGIRHYSASDPYQLVVCADSATSQVANSANNAAEGLPPDP